MAIRNTIQLGDPKLKARNERIRDIKDAKVKQIVDDLVDTMKANDLIGMAAPQIGENYQIFITNPRKTQYRADGLDDELRIYINPEIIETSEETTNVYEGCGSVNQVGEFGPVVRPKNITVHATDMDGKKFQIKADGLLARVIQHEMDHLNGLEFIDRVDNKDKLVGRDKYIKDIKDSSERAANLKITLAEYKLLD